MSSVLFDWMPKDPTSLQVDAILGLYRRDPAFVRVIDLDRSLRVWDGDRRDVSPPSERECPWVRLTFRSGPSSWAISGPSGTRAHDMPLFMDAEICVLGTDSEDLRRLWWLVSGVVLPRDGEDADEAVVEALKPTGIYGIEVVQAGTGPLDAAKTSEANFLRGFGTIKFYSYITM